MNEVFLNKRDDPKSTINTEAESKAVSKPANHQYSLSQKGRRRTSTSIYFPEDVSKKKQKRPTKRSRKYTKEEAALEAAKHVYADVEYQLQMTHIEYVNIVGREPNHRI